MNGRSFAAAIAALAAQALWLYAGAALLVAASSGSAGLSLAVAATATVFLSYGLAWLLSDADVDQRTKRVLGVGLSVSMLYLIFRLEIAGDPYLWRLQWLPDLVLDPGTLEGRGAAVIEVAVLSVAWARGVVQGSRGLRFDGVLSDMSIGLLVVLAASAWGPAAGAPELLRWLPVPYVAAAMFALSLMHLGPADARGRPFAPAWALWNGASVGVIAGLALLAGLFYPSSLQAITDGIVLVAQGIGLAVFYLLYPFIFAFAWGAELVAGWVIGDEPFVPEPTDTSELTEASDQERDDRSPWSNVFGWVLRSGIVILVVTVGLTVLWTVFRRFTRQRADAEEADDVVREPFGPAGGLRLFLGDALGRLGGRRASGLRGRDAIGRLYVSVLRRAEAQGLSRLPSITPLEFAPRLQEHFDSPVPARITQAYAETRYGARRVSRPELEELRARWRELERVQPKQPP